MTHHPQIMKCHWGVPGKPDIYYREQIGTPAASIANLMRSQGLYTRQVKLTIISG